MTHDRIEINAEGMFGKPVIRRVTVEQVLRKLAAGRMPAEIVAEHPRLTVDVLSAESACSHTPSARPSTNI